MKLKKKDEFSVYIEDREYTANKYVMHCFAVSMIIYCVAYLLNLAEIFIIDRGVMNSGFFPTITVFAIVYLITKKVSLSNEKTKYLIMSGMILAYTLLGASITYHVVLISVIPFLCASLYSSKRMLWFVYILTVISTFIVVYGGYYWGLCDANMALLTTSKLTSYIENGVFTLTQLNENPIVTLFVFFVLPRGLIYIAFMAICNSIFRILSESVEKARLASELEKAKIEAENANRAKSQFLARISHEIRTPINSVLGMNEMIIRESTENNIRQYAEDVKDSSVLLLSLINEILDSSKIESGKMELVPVNYELSSLLNDVYNMINIKSREKGLELVFDIDPNIPECCFGDDKRIRQILINLLTNAVKYTEKGTVTLGVSCRKDDENAVFRYSVKDTGIGIKKEDIGKIYDEFQRIDMTRNKNVEGTGLGMSIVQKLLKLMDSEIVIESEYEKGSEFSFELVQKIISDKPVGNFRERVADASDRKESRTSFVAPEATILVVDDYRMNLKVFKALMKQTKANIIDAESGQACLDILKNNHVDLVFLDHMMPGMDGIETLHKIRDEKLCEGIPIIMLTANAIAGDKEKYIAEGFNDFLSKPIIVEKLNAMVVKYLPKKLVQLSDEETNDNVSEAIHTDEKSEIRTAEDAVKELGRRLPEIDIKNGLMLCGNDTDFYIECLGDFAALKIKSNLVAAMKEKDYKTYCVHIHGFKNNAYTIGAAVLGDIAYEMEKLTK
ncbi:MAG: response regulator, partial [Oscillospiraceae bacterium]|nr:response regulator [Oscillospiraceae bacterium]